MYMDEKLSDAEVEAIYKLADDVQKLNKRLLNIEDSMRVQTASMDEKYDRIIDALEKMMPTPKSESEPLAICFDVMVESVESASAEIDLASIEVTDKSDSTVATGVLEDGDLCLDVSTIDSTQAEVTSDLFSADSSSVFADAVIGEESFEIKFCVSNYFSDFCLLPVCENASMTWPTHFTMHMDLSDRLKHILPSKQKVRILKPPAKPPDCRVLKFDGREPFPVNYYFDAKYDIVKCIKTVQQEGLYGHIRFEHYLCEKFVGMMGAEHLFMIWGNSIIMILIENCYTSTQWEIGAWGKSQMHWAAKMVIGRDMRIPWILYKQEDLFGDGMVFTHDKALRLHVESSLREEDKLELATLLIEKAKVKDVSSFLPIEVVLADKFAAGSEAYLNFTVKKIRMGIPTSFDSLQRHTIHDAKVMQSYGCLVWITREDIHSLIDNDQDLQVSECISQEFKCSVSLSMCLTELISKRMDLKRLCGTINISVCLQVKISEMAAITELFTNGSAKGRYCYFVWQPLFEIDVHYVPIKPIRQGTYDAIRWNLKRTSEKVIVKMLLSIIEKVIIALEALKELKILSQVPLEDLIPLEDIMMPTHMVGFQDFYLVYDIKDIDSSHVMITRIWAELSEKLGRHTLKGQLQIEVILFLPIRAPFGIFDIHKKMNIIKLYGRRLFVMDSCERLTPKYFRFIKGVVDFDELLLKLFREILQPNKILEVIREDFMKKCINMFNEIAENEEDHLKSNEIFSKNWKTCLHEDGYNYDSKSGDEMTSLKKYVTKVNERPKEIYCDGSDSWKVVGNLLFLEGLKKKEYEVRFMVHANGEYAVGQLKEYDGNNPVSALNEGLTTDVVDAREEFDNTLIEDRMLHDKVADRVCLPRFANNIFMFSVPRPPEVVDQPCFANNIFMFSCPRPPEVAEFDHEIILEAKEMGMPFGQAYGTNKVLHLMNKCNQATLKCADVANLENKVFPKDGGMMRMENLEGLVGILV